MILRAAWVVPVGSPPIRDGAVTVAGERITGVGPWAAAERGGAARVVDLGDAVLTPGLVNPHTHLELTCYAGRLASGPLWEWFGALLAQRRLAGRLERERRGAHEGAWESLRAGVTCVGDISRTNNSWIALREVPIRKVCFVEVLSLANDPPRDVDELLAAVDAIEPGPRLHVGISPHAPYTVTADTLRGAIELATRRHLPWTMHLAETPEEIAFFRGDPDALPEMIRALCRQRGVVPPGQPPGVWLARITDGLTPGLIVHGNYLDDDDARRLVDSGHTLVYCPRSHRFFGHPSYPLRRFRDAGVRLLVGTDSLASNESLSVLDELHVMHARIDPALSPTDLLRMATLDAAAALGLAGAVGSLEADKQADIAAFPIPPDTADPTRALIEQAPCPVGVWVAGRRVVG